MSYKSSVCAFLNLAAGRYRTKRWWGRFRLWCPQSQKQVNRLTSSLPPPFTSWPVTAQQPLSAVTSPVRVSTHTRLPCLLLPRSSTGRRGSLLPQGAQPDPPPTSSNFQIPLAARGNYRRGGPQASLLRAWSVPADTHTFPTHKTPKHTSSPAAIQFSAHAAQFSTIQHNSVHGVKGITKVPWPATCEIPPFTVQILIFPSPKHISKPNSHHSLVFLQPHDHIKTPNHNTKTYATHKTLCGPRSIPSPAMSSLLPVSQLQITCPQNFQSKS